ncbi:MAG: hypothetical protein QOJ15_5335, partial [Bradyrhizobium sp.]|nr:hypothetical protein [Bradyrhizobium sp.]
VNRPWAVASAAAEISPSSLDALIALAEAGLHASARERLLAPLARTYQLASLESASYGTHSMRRTKAAQIYRKTRNLRAVQLLLGHTKLESTVRYLGIEVDEALNMAEQIEL